MAKEIVKRRIMKKGKTISNQKIEKPKTEKPKIIFFGTKNVRNFVEKTVWKQTEHQMPLSYKSGMFDGKKSDEVIAEGKSGKRYLATYYEGTLDGHEFKQWYENDNYEINEPILRFMYIPE